MSFKTCAKSASDSFVERKSKFIGYATPVENEREAIAFIEETRKKHSDATHNVYAYVLTNGLIERFSDDGEPSGTAGRPMLEVIKKMQFTDVCVVGTRYFGGILLGAGGLVRAYAKTAKVALDAAGVCVKEAYLPFVVVCDYKHAQYVEKLEFIRILDVQYTDAVTFSLAVNPEFEHHLMGIRGIYAEKQDGTIYIS